jgi:ribA/ribD-fused uncharacterized protein
MEDIINPSIIAGIKQFIEISQKDPKAEFECKLLAGKIITKDIVDRLIATSSENSVGAVSTSDYINFQFGDNRVTVAGCENINRLVKTRSFSKIPLLVQKKVTYPIEGGKTTIDSPESFSKFTIRSEEDVRKDWAGSPEDPKAHVRFIHRKSYKTTNELFQIDISMVKTKPLNAKFGLANLIKEQPHTYELEIEFVNRKTKIDSNAIVADLLATILKLLQSFYHSEFVLPCSDIERYSREFMSSSNVFFNPITLEQRHIMVKEPNNIYNDYTVTVKADGERVGLYVARDKRVLMVSNRKTVRWTGIKALTDAHVGDFLDGEFIPEQNLYCIFDIYRYMSKDVKNLPLLVTDEDVVKNPHSSRLGIASKFVESLSTDFETRSSLTPLRIETKLFLAGNGASMQDSIDRLLNTEFEYETDGLIFTPRSSGVAPSANRQGDRWNTVYKWKPAYQNSIDFLLIMQPEITFDPVLDTNVKTGSLIIGRSADNNRFLYPRETITGEYVEPAVPDSLSELAKKMYVPAVFQPQLPPDPDAYKIYVPTNDKKVAIDSSGKVVENNTIIECSYDIKKKRWIVMRTRYDKTYRFRVLKETMYGNDVNTAESVWTSIHVPVTEEMLLMSSDNPIEDQGDGYYRDDLVRSKRVFAQAYNFHSHRVKGIIYDKVLVEGNTLLELGVGTGGDLGRWQSNKISKIVGLDITLSNLTNPRNGAAVRYLQQKKRFPHQFLPDALFVEGDMIAVPLFEQSDKYMPVLVGTETAPTEYLEKFKGLQQFDVASCQFAMHYACQSEDTLKAFIKNVETHCKTTFFGTCLDGEAVYTLLMGKKKHIFAHGSEVAGEYVKEYEDRESWTEELGLSIKVMMESFVEPKTEYLVPFKKVTELFGDAGFILEESRMFEDIYREQNAIILSAEEQVYSFLNRTFTFKKTEKKAEAKVEKIEEEVKPEPTEPPKALDMLEPPPPEEKSPKKKRKLKLQEDAEPNPVLFDVGDETGGEFSLFSNSAMKTVEIDGITYNSVTHYYIAMKAREAKNDELYEKIVSAATAKAAKALEKKIVLKDEEWEPKQDAIMLKAVRAKFTQHPEIRAKLMETGDRPIGFADARDIYWGIGTSRDTDKARKKSKWRGQNKLGMIIHDLRNVFMRECSPKV